MLEFDLAYELSLTCLPVLETGRKAETSFGFKPRRSLCNTSKNQATNPTPLNPAVCFFSRKHVWNQNENLQLRIKSHSSPGWCFCCSTTRQFVPWHKAAKLPELFLSPVGIFLSYNCSVTILFEIFWLCKTQSVYGLLLQSNLQGSRSAQLFSNSLSFAANVTLQSVLGHTSTGMGAMDCTAAGSPSSWSKTTSGRNWDCTLPFHLHCSEHHFELKSLS